MYSQPKLMQGVFEFQGQGLKQPFPLSSELSYTVPAGKRAQLIYFRGGNASDDLVYIVFMRDGKPMRFFPLGARADSHVALAVVEDLLSDTKLEVYIAAPETTSGTVVIDVGLVEI